MRGRKQTGNGKIRIKSQEREACPSQDSWWKAFFCAVLTASRHGRGGWQGTRASHQCVLRFRHLGYPHFIHIVIHRKCAKTRGKHGLSTTERNHGWKWNVFSTIWKETKAIWKEIKAIWKETGALWRKPRHHGRDPGDTEEKHPQPNFSKAAGSGKPLTHRALRMGSFSDSGGAR